VSFVQILAPELTDRLLADFLDLDDAVTVNLHIRSIDQAEAIKTIKRKLSDLDKMKIEENKKAVRSGYDMDILPPTSSPTVRRPSTFWPICSPATSGCSSSPCWS
jgi:hypothetical protein